MKISISKGRISVNPIESLYPLLLIKLYVDMSKLEFNTSFENRFVILQV